MTFVLQVGAGPSASCQSRAERSKSINFPTIVDNWVAFLRRLSSTSGPNKRSGNSSLRFSHRVLESLAIRSRSRCRSPILRACPDRVSWSIYSDVCSILSSESSSSKSTASRSWSQIGSDGNPTDIQSLMAHSTRGSPSRSGNLRSWHARNLPRTSAPTSIRSGHFWVILRRNRNSSRWPDRLRAWQASKYE